MTWPAILMLENGRSFAGRGFGAQVESHGEVVFNTAITGYQEIVSDPSYCGQIVVMTATQIGNVGVNADDVEAERVVSAGLVVREASPIAASWRATSDLDAWLSKHGVAGLAEIDTRALTRVLREEGAMRGAICPAPADAAAREALLARIRGQPTMAGLDLVPRVTCREPHPWSIGTWRAVDDATRAPVPAATRHVVVYDFGVKHNILRLLVDHGCRVTVVPATTPASDVLARKPDGVLLSNGPGDPAAVGYGIAATQALLAAGVPLFGICLGHQILGLALGARTFKLAFGHHGANHPVRDVDTGRVEVTSQNHGFAIDPASLPAGVRVTHVNLFDGSCAGIACEARAAFGVQYHPEASPGPRESAYLFARFVAAMDARG